MDSHDPPHTFAQARNLVLQHGWNSMAYQILNPGFRHWFPAEQDGVIGYVSAHGYRVVAGEPVCPAERLAPIMAAFAADARCAGERVCYLGAQERLLQHLDSHTRPTCLLVGAQPVWTPACWSERLPRKSSFRGQLSRARNKQVRVAAWPVARATNHSALQRCLDTWLHHRRLPPLHFTVESDTLDNLGGRRVFVAEQSDQVIGFLVASPVPRREGWLIEQIIRLPRAPNGTTELLLDTAMRDLAASGAAYATLGPSPLSQRADVAQPRTPLLTRLALAWVRAHGRRFYNFDGLDAFKAKFLPETWEPIYALTLDHSISLHTLYAIAGAFSGTTPLQFISRALWRGLGQEVQWFEQRVRRNLHLIR